MKKIMLVAALVVAAVVAGQAWAGGSCCPMSKKASESACSKALSGIELTAEQQTQINAIEAECKAEGSTKEACSKSMEKIRNVLTEEQRTKFDASCEKGKKEGC